MTISNKYFTIDLNGHMILRDDHGSVVAIIDQSVVTIIDSNPSRAIPGYIFEERYAAANGHETLDTDASALAAQAGDLACERYVLDKGKLQVEVLCNLDQVPEAGAIVFAAFLPIEGATGLPVRVWAIAEE